MPSRIAIYLACSIAITGLLNSTLEAEIPKPPAPLSEFEKLTARTRQIATTGEWKQTGWKDDELEAACNKIIASCQTITGDQSLSLPLDFKDPASATSATRPRLPADMLQVSNTNLSVPFASKSIFLVDGSIHISHASDCIVIARGAIEISHANHCLLIAGHHIDISHDGNGGFGFAPGGNQPAAAGSILLSGGSASISHAHGTVCSAPQRVEISHATQVRLIGSPSREIGHQQGCQFYDKAAPPFAIPAPSSLPPTVFTVTQIVAPDDHTKQLVSVERNGMEYVLRPGSKIADEKGQPIPPWTSWTIGFICENFVLFTNGQDDVSIRLPQ